jgi:hypothetical protein
MSFRLFIYYCALCGGVAAFVGWAVGRSFDFHSKFLADGVKGFWLGVTVAFVLSFVDVRWSGRSRQFFSAVGRILVAVLIGAAGGFLGGILAQALYRLADIFYALGWTVTGALVGLAVCIYDLLEATLLGQDVDGPLRKVLHGVIGGTIGGFLGGVLSAAFRGFLTTLFGDKPSDQLWSPSAWGFVALGACIGLLIALTQVILKEAWLKVEAGFRAGREQILAKPVVTIGRAENCDVGLFGDAAVDRLHARILRKGEDYLVADAESTTGTFVNGQRVDRPRVLQSGDAIRIGRAVLRFGERAKQAGR